MGGKAVQGKDLFWADCFSGRESHHEHMREESLGLDWHYESKDDEELLR